MMPASVPSQVAARSGTIEKDAMPSNANLSILRNG